MTTNRSTHPTVASTPGAPRRAPCPVTLAAVGAGTTFGHSDGGGVTIVNKKRIIIIRAR